MGRTSWCLSKLRYYIFFCKPAFFISGLIFGHSLAEYGVVSILISYLNDNWVNANLQKSVIIVSATEGWSSVLTIVLAHIADTYLGRFKIVLFSTVPYVGGLMVLWLVNPGNTIGIYFVAAMLIAIGQAGREPPLKAFLADQLRNLNQEEEHNVNKDEERLNKDADNINKDEKRVEARTSIWWRLAHILGVVIAIVVLGPLLWVDVFRISTIVMGIALLLFSSGFTYYHHEKPTGSPLTTVFLVFKAAIMKHGVSYSDEPNDYFKNQNSDKLPLAPVLLCSRWLDKAALVVETSSISAEEQEKKGKLCTVAQVKEVKLLLRMVPMWATFCVYCLVKATGSTFFFEQTSNLDFHIGNLMVPIVTLYLIQTFSKYASSLLCDFVISKWFNEKRFLAMKVRIGVGMGFSCLCCVIARLVEVHRIQKVTEKGILDDQYATISMSIFWLTPQFCLLGLMEGLTEDGLVKFFYYQVAESMRSYGGPFNDFALGIGKFISIFWVLTFSCWFGDTINNSRLANYYGILVILSLGNLFVIYGYVSKYVYKDAIGEEKSLDKALEEIANGIQSVDHS